MATSEDRSWRPDSDEILIGILSIVATVAFADGNGERRVAATARAEGIGVNNAIIGRLIGSGNTLFTTSIDVSNNAGVATQVDFYFDAVDLATGEPYREPRRRGGRRDR